MWIYDPTGHQVLAVNRAGAAIFGFHSPGEMLATVTRAGEQL